MIYEWVGTNLLPEILWVSQRLQTLNSLTSALRRVVFFNATDFTLFIHVDEKESEYVHIHILCTFDIFKKGWIYFVERASVQEKKA